jgi:hypothetical protein
MAAPASPSSRSAKAPGFVFAALAAAVAVLLIAALSPTQPPPPPVAEYAPEAVQAIKDAPPEQSAQNGLADGAAGNDTANLPPDQAKLVALQRSTTTTQPPVDTARVRQCFGDPPRQTEDPQSPPCVPYFDGDNGAVTSKGVDANEIRVEFPNTTDQTIFTKLLT